MSADDARELANTDSVESKLGGVIVRYVVHGNKDNVVQQVRAFICCVLVVF